MLDTGELGHEDILRAFRTSMNSKGPKYWSNIIAHHKPMLAPYYTMLARGAASRIGDVQPEELPKWRPQRLLEMWRDVDFSRGYPLVRGEALSPFEYEILKYATGKSTIADITGILYERFGKPFGETEEELMERIIATMKAFDAKYWLLVVPY